MKALSSLLVATLAVSVAAQEPQPTFDVVSIKRSSPNAKGISSGVQPGGRYILRNASIATLVGAAYPSDISEYPGAPDWMLNDRYDIEAVPAPGTSRPDIEPMLRTLLAERFKFKGHYESPERPIYELVLRELNP